MNGITVSRSESRFPPAKAYTFWSSDFHISPIADVKDLFQVWNETKNYRIIDESLSEHCHLMNTCTKGLMVLNKANGITLGACPNDLKRKFWEAYKHDVLMMQQVDVFFVHHVTGLAELYMAFNKPIIAVVSTRYEIGRHDAEQWNELNDNLRAIASNPRNTIAANNRFDAEYIQHFTGIHNIKVLPNYCGYTNTTYMPTRSEILIGPSRLARTAEHLVDELKQAANMTNMLQSTSKSFLRIREKYGHFEYSDLASHPAIVIIPYQVSVMSFFEYMRMGIPLFAPAISLLAKWQKEYTILDEISWNCVHQRCREPSHIPPHPNSTHFPYDPNDTIDVTSIAYWLQFADFYQFPHITYFNNWEDLFYKLEHADFPKIHEQMMAMNQQQMKQLRIDWAEILYRALGDEPPLNEPLRLNSSISAIRHVEAEALLTWEEAMLRIYPQVQSYVRSSC